MFHTRLQRGVTDHARARDISRLTPDVGQEGGRREARETRDSKSNQCATASAISCNQGLITVEGETVSESSEMFEKLQILAKSETLRQVALVPAHALA